MGGLKKAPADIAGAQVLRRKTSRRVFRQSGCLAAAELIGPLSDGDEICGVTNGPFSLIDILEHVLAETGPAEVSVATWTMGIYDVERATAFVRNSLIRSIRFVLDPSMFSRRPELSAILVRGFGPEAFRGVNSHAKFATVRGADKAVAIRSSMNLNPNKRLESFDISVGDEVCSFFERLVDEIWRKVPVDNESQSESIFRDLLDAAPAKGMRRPNPFLAAT